MTPEQTAAPALPLHPQDEMECRRCGVHCDKVVHPGACLSRGCPFVYSYEAWGHTYVGCMQKVYDVEIDLDMLRAAEERKPGFGAIRAVRRPLPMCKAEVERTYESRLDEELETALARLTAGEREVVALRVLLDLDAGAAARVLGISATNCTTRLNRALKKLEEALHVAA
jgi:RNA polymerase sigma factor (sigma-70 family)